MQKSKKHKMSLDSPQGSTGDGQTDVLADVFFILFSSKAQQLPSETNKCFVCSFFPPFSLSFVRKGHILSNLLTLSGALLSCSRHESFLLKFSCLSFGFLHGLVPVFCTGISRLSMLLVDPQEYTFCLSVCGHWVLPPFVVVGVEGHN